MGEERIARVFPRRTAATPTDDLAFVGGPPLFTPEVDTVHISVAFTWDLPAAERLAAEWSHVAPVSIGGPATGAPGGEFVPGVYLKPGYVITSRGCGNRCWFCSVWRREGQAVRELPIRDGWNVLDDNLLACSEEHVRAVFAMLRSQPPRTAQFTGGLDAARLERWHAELMREVQIRSAYFAYDEPGDLEPLRDAGRLLRSVGFRHGDHDLRCYVLCGFPRDTIIDAEKRMRETLEAGFFPMAMAWRDVHGKRAPEWVRFQREWVNPWIVATKAKVGAGMARRTK